MDWDMILRMTDSDEPSNSQATILCKSCGLCCTGHLFSWVRLNAADLDPSEALGLNVIRSDPRQRGFTQPCPLWDGQCTVYTSPHYPRGCRTYQCKLLKLVIEGKSHLPGALDVVQQAMAMIRDVDAFLPNSANVSFRERLITIMERGNANPDFQLKADALLHYFDNHFGVNDFFDRADRA
jgi:uncharacterized protein